MGLFSTNKYKSSCHYFRIRKPLKVTVSKQPKCSLGNKSRQLAIKATAANGGPVFKKDGQTLALLWPTA
jgi:hypothetical protein